MPNLRHIKMAIVRKVAAASLYEKKHIQTIQ